VFVFKSDGGGGGGRESPLRKTAIKSVHRAPVGTHFRRLKTVAAADRLAVGQQLGSRDLVGGGTHKYSFQTARKFKCLAASVYKHIHTHIQVSTYYLRRICKVLCINIVIMYCCIILYYIISRMTDIFFHKILFFQATRDTIHLLMYIIIYT